MLYSTSLALYSLRMSSLLDIGASLARTRRALDMSQRELAAVLGTSQQQVARWEATNYRTARLERVASAARALGVADGTAPLVAEPTATYRTRSPAIAAAVKPVRDVGEIAARLRARSDDLHNTFSLDRIGVFGSFATGTQCMASDVDLLVHTRDPGGIRFVEVALFIEGLLGRTVDLVRPDLLLDALSARVRDEVIYVWRA
jgi:uncharacterized protein